MIKFDTENTTFEQALAIGEQIFGNDYWSAHDVVTELEHIWDIQLEEAEIGQGSSSSDTSRERKLLMLREWCKNNDLAKGNDINWFLDSLRTEADMQNDIDQVWDHVDQAIDDAWNKVYAA